MNETKQNTPSGLDEVGAEKEQIFWEGVDRDLAEKQKYLKICDFREQQITHFEFKRFIFSEYNGQPTVEATILILSGALKGKEKIYTLYPSRAREISFLLGCRQIERWAGEKMTATVVNEKGKDRLVLQKYVKLD
jgi:hypothetical protein